MSMRKVFCEMPRGNRRFLLHLCVVLLAFQGLNVLAATNMEEQLAVTARDFNGIRKGIAPGIEAFDLSPAGTTLAVEFGVGEGNKTWEIWVVEWEVRTRKILVDRRIEGPILWSQTLPNPQYKMNLRFTPDGQLLIAQVGRQILVLDAAHLTQLHSLSVPRGNAIRRFSVAPGGKFLAVLSSADSSPCEPTNVGVFDLRSGEQAANWTVRPPSCPYSMSFSPDGNLLLLSGGESAWFSNGGAMLVDSRAGKLIRAFRAAGKYVGRAEFVGEDRIAALAGVDMNTPADIPRSTLDVWDARSGELLKQMSYSRFGIRGSMAVASHAQLLAVLSSGSESRTLSDNDVPGFRRLLLFHLVDTEPFYVSPDLDFDGPPMIDGGSDSLVRISADGAMIAIPTHGAIVVYRVAADSSRP